MPGGRAVGEAVAVGGFLGEFAAEAVEFAGAEVGTVEEDLDFEEFLDARGNRGILFGDGRTGPRGRCRRLRRGARRRRRLKQKRRMECKVLRDSP